MSISTINKPKLCLNQKIHLVKNVRYLTGLEIDAAKNGQHPNLDIILKTEIEKSPYLVFLKDFEKFTRRRKLRF